VHDRHGRGGSVDILRALLEGDFDTYWRLHAALAPEQLHAFAVVLAAACNEAVPHGSARSPARQM
jgi:hypothetical protein